MISVDIKEDMLDSGLILKIQPMALLKDRMQGFEQKIRNEASTFFT